MVVKTAQQPRGGEGAERQCSLQQVRLSEFNRAKLPHTNVPLDDVATQLGGTRERGGERKEEEEEPKGDE